MKIRVLYWPSLGAGSPILGNVRGFQHFGDVEFHPIYRPINKKLLNEGADLLFLPDFEIVLRIVPELFTVLQMGGRGPAQAWQVGIFNQLHYIVEQAEVVTMLDTNLYRWLKKKKKPWKWKRVHLVPNGLHYDLFQPDRPNPPKKDFIVLTPKIGGPAKPGINIAMVANKVHEKGYKNIKFIAPVQNPEAYAPSQDITPIEPRPYYKMVELYQKADIVLNIPMEEVLPNSVFEAFMCAKPLIITKETVCIGDIQTVATSHLEKMKKDFGMNIEDFNKKWSRKYWTGTHFLAAEKLKEIPDLIIELYENPDLRRKIGREGREWSLKLNYTWKDKCKILLDLAKKEGWWA